MARDYRTRDDDEDDDRPRRARRPRDDDEDDDRPRSARQKPKADNTVKVLLIVGGVLVAVVLICAGLALTVYRSIARVVNEKQAEFQKLGEQNQKRSEEFRNEADKRDAANVARRRRGAPDDKGLATAAVAAFVLEVRGGHTATAYQLTTPEYRQRVTQSAFDATAASCGPGLGVGLVEAGFFAPDTGSTYSFDIWAGIAAGRETTVKVTAVRQGHHWLVDQFTVVIVTK